jgi:putative DNA primase/helicase
VDAVKCRDCERTVEPPNVVCDICVAKLAGDPFQDDDNELLPAPSHPVVVARVLIKEFYQHAEGLTLLWWRGDFYTWTGTHWNTVPLSEVRARIYPRLEHAEYEHMTKDGPEVRPWEPTRRKVGDLLEALAALVNLNEQTDPPAWIGDDAGPVISVANGNLDITDRVLQPHIPRWFNLMSLPFDFERSAPAPIKWLQFLQELWPEDPDAIALLQDWFGYVLSGRTDLHKILLLIGPPRSGKGTLIRVLTGLIGRENIAAPTLASLGTNFGLQPLIGKSVAAIGDARLGGPNTYAVVERLLSISGEDSITVDRKYLTPWTGQLGVRFTVVSNELPNLGDASGAVASRFLVLTLAKSWLGNENPSLTQELLTELPGILLWGLDGLDRLQARGRFTEPQSSVDAVMALADLSSPVAAFVREECQRGAGHEVEIDRLYAAWRHWCETQGRHPGSKQVFGRDLRAAVPGLKVTQPRDGDARHRCYSGIALRVPPAMDWTAFHRVPDDEPTTPNGAKPEVARDGTRANPFSAAHEQHLVSPTSESEAGAETGNVPPAWDWT